MHREGKVSSDATWRVVKLFKEVDSARLRYLTRDECVRLVNACDPDFRPLVQAALYTGCRYGELTRLTVADFNPDAGTMLVRESKSGKIHHVVLTDEGCEFFGAATAGRVGDAAILEKRGGGRWGRSHQVRPIRQACGRAGIAPPASFHVLRHTYASLLMLNGVPLAVVAQNLGHTDTRMVEKHYAHLAPSYVAQAIRAAAPE